MSSWERSRRIPWSRIDQSVEAKDLERYRESVYRDVQRQRVQMERSKKNDDNDDSQSSLSDNETTMTTTTMMQQQLLSSEMMKRQQEQKNKSMITQISERYSNWDLVKHTCFGACLGSITGAVFGFMDSMRVAADSKVLKKASTGAKGRFLFQGTTRSGLTFGAFFGGFHAVKYGVHVVADPGEYAEVAMAGVVSMGAMVAKPATRSSLPYAGMLVIMDAVNIYMRDNSQ